jgi:hypothetical protein
MASRSHSNTGARVSALVDRFFGGNRTAAARAWGVPQATVQRLVVGDTQSVKAITLDKIAKAHDTGIDWLMSARGPNPLETDRVPYVEYADFETLVNGLELSEPTRLALLDLPRTVSVAHTILCHWGLTSPNPPGQQPDDVRQASQDARYKAAALQFTSWGYLFDGMIKAYGRERVREKLESEFQRIRLGFHPVPLELMWLNEAKPVLGQLEERFKQRGGRTGTVLIDYPALPPLDAVVAPPARPGRPSQKGMARQSKR